MWHLVICPITFNGCVVNLHKSKLCHKIYVDSSDDEHLSFYIYLKSPHHVIVDRHYFVGIQGKKIVDHSFYVKTPIKQGWLGRGDKWF